MLQSEFGICTMGSWSIIKLTYNRFCLNTLYGHTDWVRKVALTSSEELLASCGNDKVLINHSFNNLMGLDYTLMEYFKLV